MLFSDGNNKDKDQNWLTIPLGLILSVLLLFLNSIGWLNGIKSNISYVLGPIYTTSSSLATGVREYFTTLINISDFREEYNQMKIELAEYEIKNLGYEVLEDENADLKTQLNLANKEYQYLHSKVLDHIETDYMIVNKGSKAGVSKGDILVLGDSFIGITIEVGQYTSKVRLPISKSSFLESIVISSSEEEEQRILSRAVVSGSSDGIRIENIGMNSGVENGDTVIVNDSKVGENLVLGTVVGLSEDPASTTRTGYVSPVVDYYDLINVFLRIENVD